MTAPDLTKLTAKELHDTLSTGLTSWTPPLYAVMREFVRRAEGYALACADRDSARDELAEMKALRDAAKSDHKEACRILRNYQTIAEERGREIKALIRERDELHRRAQANDALRSHAETVRKERESRNRVGADDCFTDNARSRQRESEAIESILSLLAAAPAAPPTPAAPVTDAEIEAAITALTVDARREADALRVNPEASGAASEKRANRQVQLRALIERRVASAGAAPVDSEREAAIEAWCAEAVALPAMEPGRKPYEGGCAGYWLTASKINEAVRLMRSAPAGDQDAKLRELRARLLSTAASLPNRQMGHSDEDFDRGYVEACENWAQEIDHLLAAPAASAIAAAPEAPAWREKLDAAAAEIGDEHSYALSIALSDVDYDLRTVRNFVFALREQVESHARRIEALERAAQEGSK